MLRANYHTHSTFGEVALQRYLVMVFHRTGLESLHAAHGEIEEYCFLDPACYFPFSIIRGLGHTELSAIEEPYGFEYRLPVLLLIEELSLLPYLFYILFHICFQ